jgi:hypothetical protein
MFNSTINNILIISWQSVLFVEGTGEIYQPVASHGNGNDITKCCTEYTSPYGILIDKCTGRIQLPHFMY